MMVVLIVILGVGGGLRAEQALEPNESLSTDERFHAQIAFNIAERGEYGDPPAQLRRPEETRFVSPPGAPLLFGLAYKLHPKTEPVGKLGRPDIPAAHWAQALVGTAIILAAFALANALAGGVAGLIAAAVTAFYPPLVAYTGELLTEPLAALLVTLSSLTLAHAWGRWPPWRFALAGVLLGSAALVRSELLLMAIMGAVFVGLASLRWLGPRRSGLAAAALTIGAAVTVGPWIVHASRQAHAFVPVTRSAATFYIGTYLPGGGTSGGLKRSFDPEGRWHVRRRHGEFNDATMKQAIAARYPELEDQASLAKQARENLRRYALGHAIEYGGMMAEKARQLLFTGSKLALPRDASVALVHRLLMALMVLGLLVGLWRSRDPTLGWATLAVAGFTLFHAALTEPYARYMVKLLPTIFACGTAGGALALRRSWRRRQVGTAGSRYGAEA